MAFLDETGLAYFWNQILARLNKFVPAESGKGLSSNDYTAEEKEKLAGIEVGANKTIVDSTLSATSTNPVQNKVVNTAINNLNTLVGDTTVLDQINSALVNNQPDWNQNNETTADYIKNKPLIATDDDILNFLVDMGAIVPITNSSGEILISSSNEIYSL